MASGVTTIKAAKAVGIHRVTLQEWIRLGKVKPPKAVLRNGRAARLWSAADLARLRKIKKQTYRRGRGRKKA